MVSDPDEEPRVDGDDGADAPSGLWSPPAVLAGLYDPDLAVVPEDVPNAAAGWSVAER